MDTAEVKRTIMENAVEVSRLHDRIHATFRVRENGPTERATWRAACAEFHARYDALAFPGGYASGLSAITAGDAHSIETALCFLELRPYFFRSGYMYEVLLRRVKRATLSLEQAARLQVVLERRALWRAKKLANAAA